MYTEQCGENFRLLVVEGEELSRGRNEVGSRVEGADKRRSSRCEALGKPPPLFCSVQLVCPPHSESSKVLFGWEISGIAREVQKVQEGFGLYQRLCK